MNMNFIIFIGLNPFIVIYTQRPPYVINLFYEKFLNVIHIINLNNVTLFIYVYKLVDYIIYYMHYNSFNRLYKVNLHDQIF